MKKLLFILLLCIVTIAKGQISKSVKWYKYDDTTVTVYSLNKGIYIDRFDNGVYFTVMYIDSCETLHIVDTAKAILFIAKKLKNNCPTQYPKNIHFKGRVWKSNKRHTYGYSRLKRRHKKPLYFTSEKW